MERKLRERLTPRQNAEVAITCRPYGSSGTLYSSDGVIHNFSKGGIYIEASHDYKIGTILVLRTVRHAPMSSSVAYVDRPPSICLAEVKWRYKLDGDNVIRFGFGLRYLN